MDCLAPATLQDLADSLLVAADRHGLECTTLDVRNSGDTAGSRDEVVGYGSYAFG